MVLGPPRVFRVEVVGRYLEARVLTEAKIEDDNSIIGSRLNGSVQ